MEYWLPVALFLLLSPSAIICIGAFHPLPEEGSELKSAVFLSPSFELGPGHVVNNYYYNIDFPRGHIALKKFYAEVVDETGNSVPLHETYLHHWVVIRYYARVSWKGKSDQKSEHLFVRNSGICQDTVLGQYFGLGSETRGTRTDLPTRYGIEVGNPEELPDGYEERWVLNVHAIDTRGAVDVMGCTECRCELYNLTHNENGQSLPKDYIGGLHCCYDKTKCRVNVGFKGEKRVLYLKYSVQWLEWSPAILPVRIYIFDVTDKRKDLPEENSHLGCQIEYEIKPCLSKSTGTRKCVDSSKTKVVIPQGGDLVYAVAHQHSGGTGAALYGQDGRLICSSLPIYGNGSEAGNEVGYIVGMSTCYGEPGSIKIADGETLTVESNYSSSQMHTGVMGLFYVLIADSLPTLNISFSSFMS